MPTMSREPVARGAAPAATAEPRATVHIARQLGTPVPIDQVHIDSLHDRYQNVYGQR